MVLFHLYNKYDFRSQFCTATASRMMKGLIESALYIESAKRLDLSFLNFVKLVIEVCFFFKMLMRDKYICGFDKRIWQISMYYCVWIIWARISFRIGFDQSNKPNWQEGAIEVFEDQYKIHDRRLKKKSEVTFLTMWWWRRIKKWG